MIYIGRYPYYDWDKIDITWNNRFDVNSIHISARDMVFETRVMFVSDFCVNQIANF